MKYMRLKKSEEKFISFFYELFSWLAQYTLVNEVDIKENFDNFININARKLVGRPSLNLKKNISVLISETMPEQCKKIGISMCIR